MNCSDNNFNVLLIPERIKTINTNNISKNKTIMYEFYKKKYILK